MLATEGFASVYYVEIMCFIPQFISRFVFLQEDAVLAGSAGHRLQTGLKHYDLSNRRDQDDFIAGQNLKQLMKYRDDPTLLEVYLVNSFYHTVCIDCLSY